MIPRTDRREIHLDSLRGWAALSVLIFHVFCARVLPPIPGAGWLYYFQADRAAVLLFFVLSGYVIGLTNQGPYSAGAARRYGWRRLVRLYPIYLIAVGLGALASPGVSAGTILGHLAFLQDSNATNPLAVPLFSGNEPLWTLHYEALFYLCFLVWWRWPALVVPTLAGLLLAACVATGWAPAPAVIITHAVGAAFWLSGLLLARLPRTSAPVREGAILTQLCWLHCLYHFAPVQLVQQGLALPRGNAAYLPVHDLVYLPGCVIAVAVAGSRQLPAYRLWWVLTAGLALAGFLIILAAGKDLLTARWGFATLWLLAGAVAGFLPQPLGLARLAVVGGFSYALYVVHLPVMVLLARGWPATTGGVGPMLLSLVTLGIAFPGAWWLERRLQPWLHRRLLPQAATSRP